MVLLFHAFFIVPSFRFVDNEEWYKKVNIIEFLSGIGKNFRIGAMLLKDSVSQRMKSEHGMNFAEFTYQMFQANDWLHLLNSYECRFQVRKHMRVYSVTIFLVISRILETTEAITVYLRLRGARVVVLF